MDKGNGLLESLNYATTGIVIGVGYEKICIGRWEIAFIRHGKVKDLMSLFQKEFPFLKENCFRAAVEVEEFIGEDDFH